MPNVHVLGTSGLERQRQARRRTRGPASSLELGSKAPCPTIRFLSTFPHQELLRRVLEVIPMLTIPLD